MGRMDPGPVTVRPVQAGDLARLLLGASPRDRAHHEERLQMQERGEATYLVAWNDDVPCGRVTVFHRSKYLEVRQMSGDFPEMNALQATPRGFGIGSQIIASAEARAKAGGARRIGLAVGHENVDARRLYERRGYVEWEHGDVVDRWRERDATGEIAREHVDLCSYLVKDLTLVGTTTSDLEE